MVVRTMAVQRIGEDVVLRIPADVAGHAGIQEGTPVRVTIEPAPPRALGLLKDVLRGYHFDRRKEGR